MRYLTPRWLAVYGYLLIVLIATPYLPLLIQWASSRWSAGSISGFVLGVEISLGVLLIVSTGVIFFHNRRKFPSFALIIGGLIAFASLFYLVIPNPYKLTHLPEYAILGVLILHALKEKRGRTREKVNEAYSYPVRMSPSENTSMLCKTVFRFFTLLNFPMGTLFNGVNTGIMALVKSNRVYLRSAMITGVLGTIDELYQGILPLRYFAWRDIVMNGLGGLLGLTIFWALTRK